MHFFYFRCCPVDCTVGLWGSWSACNAACDKTGTQTRSRSITTQKSCNGKACPPLTHNRICNGKCCPKNCQLSGWSSWGSCVSPTGKSRIDLVFVLFFGTVTQRCSTKKLLFKLLQNLQQNTCIGDSLQVLS